MKKLIYIFSTLVMLIAFTGCVKEDIKPVESPQSLNSRLAKDIPTNSSSSIIDIEEDDDEEEDENDDGKGNSSIIDIEEDDDEESEEQEEGIAQVNSRQRGLGN